MHPRTQLTAQFFCHGCGQKNVFEPTQVAYVVERNDFGKDTGLGVGREKFCNVLCVENFLARNHPNWAAISVHSQSAETGKFVIHHVRIEDKRVRARSVG